MPKISGNQSTERYSARVEPGTDVLVIEDKYTGTISTLRGYGALRDDYVVRKDIDLTKPIAPQASKKVGHRTKKQSTQKKRRRPTAFKR